MPARQSMRVPVDRFPLLVEVVDRRRAAPRPPLRPRLRRRVGDGLPGHGAGPRARARRPGARGLGPRRRVRPRGARVDRRRRVTRAETRPFGGGQVAFRFDLETDEDARPRAPLARRLGPRGRPGLTESCSLRVQGGWRRPRRAGAATDPIRSALEQRREGRAAPPGRARRSAGVASSSGWCETPVVDRTKSMPAGTPAPPRGTPASCPANDGRSTASCAGCGAARVQGQRGCRGRSRRRGPRRASPAAAVGAAAAMAATSASRSAAVPARASSVPVARPGMEFEPPGSTAMRPTVATAPAARRRLRLGGEHQPGRRHEGVAPAGHRRRAGVVGVALDAPGVARRGRRAACRRRAARRAGRARGPARRAPPRRPRGGVAARGRPPGRPGRRRRAARRRRRAARARRRRRRRSASASRTAACRSASPPRRRTRSPPAARRRRRRAPAGRRRRRAP